TKQAAAATADPASAKTFVVMHPRQTPQQACAAGVRSGTRLRTGNTRVCVRSSIQTKCRPRGSRCVRRRGAGGVDLRRCFLDLGLEPLDLRQRLTVELVHGGEQLGVAGSLRQLAGDGPVERDLLRL